jgi:23S rRNA (uracil1939-C5)-methyltransferase
MSATSSSTPKLAAELLCRHFGTCGGCSIQDRPYEAQLLYKRGLIEAALKGVEGLPELSLLPSPSVAHYRNKMEFSFGDVYPSVAGQWLKLGMKPKGRWHTILDLEECRLPSREVPALLAAVRAWAEREKVPPYNSHKKEGILRHLVLRECKNTAERMVVLVTTNGNIPEQSFIDSVLSVYPASTILIGSNEKVSDTAVSDGFKILTGPGFVTEILRFGPESVSYRISPLSFFQTNSLGAERLYGLLRDWAGEVGGGLLLDLYCGGGGIALSLAGACRKVIGVESNLSAVADAKANAERNGLRNCDFYGANAEFLLPALLDMKPDAVVVDPPRVGLHKSAVQALLDGRPPVVFYVSCNPEALGRDLKQLTAVYAVDRLVGVDLFPHTEHVETVARLARRA